MTLLGEPVPSENESGADRARRPGRRFLSALLASLVLLAASTRARADGIAFAAGFNGQAGPGLGGFGWFYLRHDRDHLLPGGARLTLEYNSDSLRLGIDRIRSQHFELMVAVYGEALLYGVLLNYWRDGRDDYGRGFFASDIGAVVSGKLERAPHFAELVLGARRWFLDRDPWTDAALTLPPSAWEGEARLRYTYWGLGGDRSLWEPQRMWWRVHGIAFGVELSADVRSEVHPWGALAPSFGVIDPRNDPSRFILGAHQWMRAGVRVHDRVRLQLREEGHLMRGADDLVRFRVGGQNPWSVPLAGAPWGGYLADRLIAVEGSIHVRVHGEHEIGLLADGVAMPDVRRVGDGAVHVLAGVGAFADLRVRRFQIDLRAGWSPTVQPGRVTPAFDFTAAVGWSR